MILLLCDMKNICLASASINIWNLIKWKKNIHKYFSKGTKNSSITRVKHRRDIIMPVSREHEETVLWSRGFIHHQPALAIDSFSTMPATAAAAEHACCVMASSSFRNPLSILHVFLHAGSTKQSFCKFHFCLCVWPWQAMRRDRHLPCPRFRKHARCTWQTEVPVLGWSNFSSALMLASGSRPQQSFFTDNSKQQRPNAKRNRWTTLLTMAANSKGYCFGYMFGLWNVRTQRIIIEGQGKAIIFCW